jgi:hypothetical protein
MVSVPTKNDFQGEASMKAAVLYEFDPSLTSPRFVRYE